MCFGFRQAEFICPLGEATPVGGWGAGTPLATHEKTPLVAGLFLEDLLFQHNCRDMLSSDDLKRVLLDDSAATVADIEVFPNARIRFNFVAFRIARLEAFRDRRIATYANPRFVVTRFVGDEFLGHNGSISDYVLIMKPLDYRAFGGNGRRLSP